jgi:hypothetical protein
VLIEASWFVHRREYKTALTDLVRDVLHLRALSGAGPSDDADDVAPAPQALA